MRISVKPFDPERHYAIVSDWWKRQDWPVIPVPCLSETGIVSFLGDTPAAAAWVYKTDSVLSWIEWIVANPDVRREARKAVLDDLFRVCKDKARAMGFQTIFISTRSQSLQARLKSHGFFVSDQSMTNMLCHLNQEVR